MRNRAGLLKTLRRFDRGVKLCLAQLANDSMWTLNSSDLEELAQTSRQIAGVQLSMMKMSRQLASVSRQIRGLVAGGQCVAMPAPGKRRDLRPSGSKPDDVAAPRWAFAAVNTENGAVVVRVLRDKSGVWPQKEYGRFETWTQAQGFASLLNQTYGIDPVDAQHIVVSASLANARSGKKA